MNNTVYFMDFKFRTGSVTFRPRWETEILVERALKILRSDREPDALLDILDIGTGCGNIAISLTKYLPSSKITALDVSESALRTAGENAKTYGMKEGIKFIRSNLFHVLGKRYSHYFDLIISNPPYVSLEDFSSLPPEVRDDPYLALYGGTDGMDFYRRIAEKAGGYLKENGSLLMELGYGQADGVRGLLEKSGEFCDIEIHKDYAGIDRIVEARKATTSREG